jgi:hypothetical protein
VARAIFVRDRPPRDCPLSSFIADRFPGVQPADRWGAGRSFAGSLSAPRLRAPRVDAVTRVDRSGVRGTARPDRGMVRGPRGGFGPGRPRLTRNREHPRWHNLRAVGSLPSPGPSRGPGARPVRPARVAPESRGWRIGPSCRSPSSATGTGAAIAPAASSPSSSIVSVPVSPAANIQPTRTVRPEASTSAGGTGTGIAALDPSVIARGDMNGDGWPPSWGTSGAARRRRFGGRWR